MGMTAALVIVELVYSRHASGYCILVTPVGATKQQTGTVGCMAQC